MQRWSFQVWLAIKVYCRGGFCTAGTAASEMRHWRSRGSEQKVRGFFSSSHVDARVRHLRVRARNRVTSTACCN